jgi:hypothetical protein
LAVSDADDWGMRTRVIVRRAPSPAIAPRTLAAALVLLAVILAGSTGVLRVSVSGEPPALTAPTTTR